MKNVMGVTWVVVLMSLSSIVTAKNELDIVTSVTVNMINLDLDLTERVSLGAVKRKQTSPELQGIDIGVSVLDDKLYYGFTTQTTGRSVADYKEDNSGTITDSSQINDRSSFSVFAGYRVFDSGSVYLGLSKGTSTFGDQLSFDEEGPFVGLRYSFRLGATSSLSLDASYSNLQTSIFLKDDDYFNAGSNNEDGHNIDTDTTGFSYSLTWIKSLDRGRSFFIRLKAKDFDVESGTASIVDGASNTGTATITGTQKVTSLNFGVAF